RSIPILDLWIHPVENDPQRDQQRKHQNATLRSDGPSGQPYWALEGRVEQVAGRRGPAIGYGVEVGLSPVPGHVEPDGDPQVAGAEQGQAKEEPDQAGGDQAELSLSGVAPVNRAETSGEDRRRRPEVYAFGERELGVSAQEKFLKDAYEQKK